jgi:hypothetical protein
MLGSGRDDGGSPVRTEARFPAVPAKAGHYESFYIKATQPGGGRGVWIRHTIHKAPGEDANGSLWFTYFDADAPGPRATKQTFPQSALSVPDGGYVTVGSAALTPGHARGSAASDPLTAAWELSFSDDSEPFHHLPYDFLYNARLPKTKFLSPYPAASFSGSLDLGGERIELEGWPGMIGHNWGAEHAERWVWIQAPDLNGVRGDYVDIAAGRIKVGPMTSPWVANGMIVIDGVEHRLGGFDRIYGTRIEEEPTGCEFEFPGRGVNVKGRVSAPAKDFVAWIYADPKGPEHHTLNCSISDLELKVERAGKSHARFEVAGAAAYEFGSRDKDHGVPLQPFPDG